MTKHQKGERNIKLPFKWNKKREDTIIEALSQGTPKRYAAARAGITDTTLDNWIRDGNKCLSKEDAGLEINEDEKVLAAFALRVRQAEDHYLEACRETIKLAAPRIIPVMDKKGQPIKDKVTGHVKIKTVQGDWRAISWELEKKHPGLFGHLVTSNVNLNTRGGPGDDIEVDLEDEELLDAVKRILSDSTEYIPEDQEEDKKDAPIKRTRPQDPE